MKLKRNGNGGFTLLEFTFALIALAVIAGLVYVSDGKRVRNERGKTMFQKEEVKK